MAEAVTRWGGLLPNPGDAMNLDQVRFVIMDLTSKLLAQTLGDAVFIDADAAGCGWFIDMTPQTTRSFAAPPPSGIVCHPISTAFGKIDLLTALTHELGHV